MKIIPGYGNRYYADEQGNIYSFIKNKWHKMLPRKNVMGYEVVCISINGKGEQVLVHRMVASAFIPNPLNKMQINHIDNNRSNNNVSNLEWATPQENTLHALRQGRQYIPKGESHYECKINLSDVNAIRYIASKDFFGLTRKEFAKIFNVSRTAIYYILSGRNWKRSNIHISA